MDLTRYGLYNQMETYFVFGPLIISKKQFNKHIVPQLDKALELKSSSFIVGDGYGTDMLTLEYLDGKTTNVKIYHMAKKPLFSYNFDKVTGFKNYLDRDETMTFHSSKDITWIPNKKSERLKRNINRRRKMEHNISVNLNI